MSNQATVGSEPSTREAPPQPEAPQLDAEGQAIIDEELDILERIRVRMKQQLETQAHQFEDLDKNGDGVLDADEVSAMRGRRGG